MSAHKLKKLVKFILVLVLFSNVTIQSIAAEVDTATGLIKEEGWEVVRNNCIACHSANLITQNHATKNKWQAIIIWMQETQGLPQLDPETLQTILTYLSSHYGPKEATRRASLDPLLLPKNPYVRILQPQVNSVEKK